MEKRIFTSECVTCGHPDKVADAISDAILDACLAQDPNSRVACETMVTTNFCIICGEITTQAKVDYAQVAKDTIRSIGYIYPEAGFCADTVEVVCKVHTQSADIALGTNDEVGGAGDQGMMFGGACDQTEELMPLPVALARALANRLTACVESNDLLRPDGKTQVSVAYDEAGNVMGIDTVVVSIMHSEDFEMSQLRKYIRLGVIAPVLKAYGFNVENVEHIPLEDFSPYLQELKETEWLYFDSWEDAEEKIGVTFLDNTILEDENTHPYTRQKKYRYDERGLAYAALKTKATPYRGVYYAADEQFFSASFSAEYWRNRVKFMITTNMTADHPLMTEEIFLVYHGFGERYYKEDVNVTIEQYVTKNGIPATIYYADYDHPFGWIQPYAYFSVNNISYHIEFTQFDSQQGETDAQTNERFLALMKEILDGFVIE